MFRKEKIRKGIILLLLIAMAGCAKVNNFVPTDRLSEAKVSAIVEGKTSMNNIINTFGPPDTRMSVKGVETFFYKDENLNSLWIRFSSNGVVDKVVATKR